MVKQREADLVKIHTSLWEPGMVKQKKKNASSEKKPSSHKETKLSAGRDNVIFIPSTKNSALRQRVTEMEKKMSFADKI